MPIGMRYMAHLRSYYTGKGGRCASVALFDAARVENCRIELVEELPEDCTKEQMLWRERHYIETNECLNINKPIVTDEESREEKKAYYKEHIDHITQYHHDYHQIHKEAKYVYKKQYRAKHSDTIGQKQKEYYRTNREELREYQRKYREEHRDARLAQRRRHWDENKEAISAKRRAAYAAKKATIVSSEPRFKITFIDGKFTIHLIEPKPVNS